MIALLSVVGSLLSFRVRSRASLELELIALRHQVTVLRRQRPGRPRLFSTDRLLWTWLYRIWPQILNTMVLVKPATVVQWHRKGFRLYWWRRSRRLGRPRMSREIRDLIRKMSRANPLWGAPRIHGELLKLGIEVSQATVGRYLPWRPKVPSPTWRSFLHNHMHDTAAVDMCATVREVKLSPLEVYNACTFVILMAEAYAIHEPWLKTARDSYGEIFRDRASLGGLMRATDYVQALRHRRDLCQEVATAMENLDLLVNASQAGEAPRIADATKWAFFERPALTTPACLTGYPAMSVCTGLGLGGLPVAMQLIGKPWAEATLL